MNTNKACDGNPANCAHTRKFPVNGPSLDMDTRWFWSGTCKSLHHDQIAQLDQLKFLLQYEQRHKNLHIHRRVTRLYNFHRILLCTFQGGKTSPLYYEKKYRYLPARISFSWIYSYWDKDHYGKYQASASYPWTRRDILGNASNCDWLRNPVSTFLF